MNKAPHPECFKEEFLEALIKQIHGYAARVIFPVSDQSIERISWNRGRLGQQCGVARVDSRTEIQANRGLDLCRNLAHRTFIASTYLAVPVAF